MNHVFTTTQTFCPGPSLTKQHWSAKRLPLLHISIEGQIVPFGRATTVGRSGDIKMYEDVPWVSRHHMEIMADCWGNTWIRDCNSKNGTFLNGRLISNTRWTSVTQADEVAIGGCLPVKITVLTAASLLRQVMDRLQMQDNFEPLADELYDIAERYSESV